MRKTIVVDTSVFAFDFNCLNFIEESDIIIPIVVLSELDKIKTYSGSAGKNARLAIRKLDELCTNADVTKPIKLQNGSTVRIDSSEHGGSFGDPGYGDNQILACAVTNNKAKKKVTLLTRDINLRIRARAAGLLGEDYTKDNKSEVELYQGFKTIVDVDAGMELLESAEYDYSQAKYSFDPNEFVNFVEENGDGISIGRNVGGKIRAIQSQTPWGLNPLNREQAFAINMLMDTKVSLVTMIGRAGSGKTLMAIASALELVLEKRRYQKLIIYKPTVQIGKDLGALPGTLQEKIGPFMGSVMDSFEFLFSKGGSNKERDRWKMTLGMYQEKGVIEMDAIQYIRGRSIPDALILIDEAQNLTQDELKTILTRAGKGTKIILTGDATQIDAENLDLLNNGLTHVIEAFKDSELAGHITLQHCERSDLANEATERL